jgi:uncharacterized DUF497 family protein
MPLLIEFDPAKDATNLKVHGLSLARAEPLLQGFIVERQDERFDYGETRMIAIGEIGGPRVCLHLHATGRRDPADLLASRR